MKQQEDRLIQPEFWKEAWLKSRRCFSGEAKLIRSDAEMIEYWNQFAPSYDQIHTSLKRSPRVEKVIAILQEENFISAETDVIDIGCGPGNFSLPLAQICRSVTALDGAPQMCLQLEKRIKALGITNIDLRSRLWEEMDIDQEGMYKKYDLAFASMTTAVSDFETLNQMNRVSRKNCCLIFWAENGTNRARQELWQLIFNEDGSGYGMTSVIYPFNLLYSLGYFPKIEFIDSAWSHEETIEEAVESLCRYFWLYSEITPKIKDIVHDYVSSKAVNGLFSRKTEAKLGVVTWRADLKS